MNIDDLHVVDRPVALPLAKPASLKQEKSLWRLGNLRKQIADAVRGSHDNIISGLEFVTGFQRGNDIALAKHGFDAGLCGGLEMDGGTA